MLRKYSYHTCNLYFRNLDSGAPCATLATTGSVSLRPPRRAEWSLTISEWWLVSSDRAGCTASQVLTGCVTMLPQTPRGWVGRAIRSWAGNLYSKLFLFKPLCISHLCSIFCRWKFSAPICFQDFAGTKGRGGMSGMIIMIIKSYLLADIGACSGGDFR